MFGYTGDGAKNCVVTKTFEDFSTKEVAAEYNLPDYLPDVSRILRTGAQVCRAGKYVNGTTLEYDGTVVFSVVYCTSDGVMKSVEISSDYSGSMPLADCSGDCCINADTTMENVGCRLQNPRKLTVRARVRVNVDIFCAECTAPAITGKLTEEEEQGIQYKNEYIDCCFRAATADTDGKICDEIELPSGFPQAEDIISVSFSPCLCELKAENGYVSYKGSVLARALYSAARTGDGEPPKYCCYSKKIAIEGEAPGEEITENCFCTGTACITSSEYRLSPSASGEMRTIEIDVCYGIYTDIYRNAKSEVTTDMYSVDYESATETHKTGYRTALTAKPFGSTQSATLELSDAELCELVCVFGTANVTGAEKSGNKVVFSGIMDISAILSNGGNVYTGKTFSAPFRAESDAGFVPGEFDFAANASVCDISGRIDGGKLFVECEVMINYVLFALKDAVLVSTLGIRRDKPRGDLSRASITMYYPTKNDTMWDIAKKYGTTREELSAVNGTEGDTPSGEVIVIPRRTHKKPIYTRVIE